MLKFYYNPKYKYSNRTIIDVSGDGDYREIDYENIDSPDTINGHIIYTLNPLETIPTYIVENNTRRWFVSGITQLRTGKFQISLLRDLISESDLWKDEEAYISAGLATDMNKYKKWNLPFTNTKISEQRFNFSGDSSFFVFYVNENQGSGGVINEKDLEISASTIPGITSPDITVTNLNEISNYDLFGSDLNHRLFFDSTLVLKTGFSPFGEYPKTLKINYNILNEFNIQDNPTTLPNIEIKTLASNIYNNVNNCKEDLKTAISNFDNNYLSDPTFINSSQYSSLESLNSKIIFNSSDSKYYRVKKTVINPTITESYSFTESTAPSLISAIRNINFPQDATTYNSNFYTGGSYFFFLQSVKEVIKYELEYLGTGLTFDFNFTKDIRKLSTSSVRCVNICSGNGFTNEDISQALMMAQENYNNIDSNTGQIIDIQFLPFSLATTTNANFQINSTNLIAKFIDSDNLYFYNDLDDLTDLNKETDTINIVSPSRGSQFLFSPYNNDGTMEFETQVTLKPFASTIYVRPSTKGLLLYDFNDKNCLVIQEDFSLTKVTSAWAEYIRNNKNYSNIFERQIQGREFERGWERKIEQAQAKSDEWTARNISAEKAKTYTGNLPIISGISGAIATAVKDTAYMEAAQLDRSYNEAMYQESLSLSRDMFNMQLENIKSQPSIPSKISIIDCKLLDGIYLEFWSTNETEKLAIKNYYFYNGNRIDAYGTFRTYYGWFVRGKIIRSVNYTQPEITELNRRLELGVFTEVQYA